MTKPHITNPRDRKTAKYKRLHAQLAAEVHPVPEPSKLERHRALSRKFHQTAER